MQKFIDRFRYKATKAKQAQSRIKMLEKLQAIEPIKGSNEWRFNFAEPEKMPQHLIFAQELNCGYDGKPILTNVKVKVEPQDRIGVLGVNGAGKSTLIKTLIGELAAISGEIRYGTGLNIGYFAQHQLDQLREDESPLQHLTRIAPNVREQELRNYLGGFKFSNEMACNPVGPMSGGEKARLCLALIAWTKPNLLVLDEPTNHLDIETRDALTVALSSFEGAVLLVSHDRHLLKTVCDDLWIVHKGQVSEFLGDLEDYARIVLEDKKDKIKESASEDKEAPTVNKKEKRKLEAEERARISALRAPLQKQLKQVETALDKKSKKLKELNAQLAEEDFYQKDSALVSKTIKEQGELASEVEELELQWLNLSEQIESIV
ncbi:ATP-binding cassette domain-containing protein [Turicimonas muris]|uniref:ATP-binding cassette domain-containing protein n=1 Tax=Turicimonas muris TaxID=1796652 RepID=UPI0026F12798|nr:ATP-binding cassette domain-containing protein [Turicimonas muris]